MFIARLKFQKAWAACLGSQRLAEMTPFYTNDTASLTCFRHRHRCLVDVIRVEVPGLTCAKTVQVLPTDMVLLAPPSPAALTLRLEEAISRVERGDIDPHAIHQRVNQPSRLFLSCRVKNWAFSAHELQFSHLRLMRSTAARHVGLDAETHSALFFIWGPISGIDFNSTCLMAAGFGDVFLGRRCKPRGT